MRTLRRIRAMIAAITRREALDRAMDDEFALHVDLLTDDLVRRGVPRADAARQARLAFGNATAAKENARAAKGIAWFDALSQDLRFTLRVLRKHAGFTAVAVLSLGFGIGAATTMFSVIDALDFRPLPYPGADRLVSLEEVLPRDDPMCPGCGGPTTPVTARDWLSQAHSYEAAVVTTQTSFIWEHGDVEESPSAGFTTPGLLDLFGLRPRLGRGIEAADTMPGAPGVAVLTYEFWKSRFASDPRVVGTQLRARLNGPRASLSTITIVGIAPEEFRVMPNVKLWGAMPSRGGSSRTARDATVIARLKSGVSIAAATAELQGLSMRLARLYPEEYRGWGATLEPLRDRLGWAVGNGRGVMFAVAMSVLLIAVLNVTGLLLSRAVARQPEFAMRATLGASRVRLFRQLLVEGICVGLAGGLIGVVFAFGGVHIAARWFSMQSAGLDADVDLRMLSFATLVSLITGIATAVMPALRATRVDVSSNLRPRMTAPSRASRTSSALITAQIALAFLLLTTAGLLSRDFLELRYLDLGYDPGGLYATYVSGSREEWLHPAPWKQTVSEARARVAAVSGVRSASLEYESAVHPDVVRSDNVVAGASRRAPRVRAVTADFFATWKNPVLVGRSFAATDRAGSPLVAIVNSAGALAFWPGTDPLGRRVFVGDSASGGEWLTVVGVTRDIERADFAYRHTPVVYRPFDQAPLYHASVRLSIRVEADRPEALTSAQAMIRRLTGRSSAPFESDAAYLGARFLPRRFNALALDLFAGFGLLLAAMGIYGSIAFAVTQRTREIGIRVALGAERSAVLRLIARRGVVIATTGTLIGALLSRGLTRAFTSFVAATPAANPWILGGSVVVMLGMALVATFLPARRALGVNPVIALRAD